MPKSSVQGWQTLTYFDCQIKHLHKRQVNIHGLDSAIPVRMTGLKSKMRIADVIRCALTLSSHSNRTSSTGDSGLSQFILNACRQCRITVPVEPFRGIPEFPRVESSLEFCGAHMPWVRSNSAKVWRKRANLRLSSSTRQSITLIQQPSGCLLIGTEGLNQVNFFRNHVHR